MSTTYQQMDEHANVSATIRIVIHGINHDGTHDQISVDIVCLQWSILLLAIIQYCVFLLLPLDTGV